MEDFDAKRVQREQQERRVKIGGVELTFKAGIRPEDFAEYVDMTFGRLDPVPRELEAIGILDRTITAMLDPESRDAWRALRESDTSNPITTQDMHDLISHITKVHAGRPTGLASSSTNGGETTGMTSKDAVSSSVAQG